MAPKIDYEEITRLIDLLEKRRLTVFELEMEDFKIKISREGPRPSPAPAPPAQSEGEPTSAPPPNGLIEESLPEDEEGIHYVTSPMVGTFYRAPDPSSPPFVEIGDEVGPGKTLCIIEAMKLMNEIEADGEGTIEDIFIKNAQPVEYGQKLFSIRLK